MLSGRPDVGPCVLTQSFRSGGNREWRIVTRRRSQSAGTARMWTGLDAKSKLIVSYLLSGERDETSGIASMLDLAEPLRNHGCGVILGYWAN